MRSIWRKIIQLTKSAVVPNNLNASYKLKYRLNYWQLLNNSSDRASLLFRPGINSCLSKNPKSYSNFKSNISKNIYDSFFKYKMNRYLKNGWKIRAYVNMQKFKCKKNAFFEESQQVAFDFFIISNCLACNYLLRRVHAFTWTPFTSRKKNA